MSEQLEFVTDILGQDDPELANLVSLRDIARDYWRVEEQYAQRRLRESGVRLVKIDYPLMVRWADIEEFEKAHTIILSRKSHFKQEEVATPSS